MSHQDRIHRTVLPIPDRPRTGLVTYDAKDPEWEARFGGSCLDDSSFLLDLILLLCRAGMPIANAFNLYAIPP